jgi:hypothetical protein
MDRYSRRERVRQHAEHQAGRLTWAQLLAPGLSEDTVRSWIRGGILTQGLRTWGGSLIELHRHVFGLHVLVDALRPALATKA